MEPVELTSDNTGPGRSAEDGEEGSVPEQEGDDDDDDDDDNDRRKKRSKKHHRHTAEQIREMEALFRESPHPDEKQRQQLSKQLGLAPRQVKFWFQNRRTQIKAIQERHENSLLKSEIDKLRKENQRMRESMKNACCPSCSGSMASPKANETTITGEQLLRIENMRLKSEIEKLQELVGRPAGGSSSPRESNSRGNSIQENRNLSDGSVGLLGRPEMSRISTVAVAAMDEVVKMATAGEPLWLPSVETGREILNYDEYVRRFTDAREKAPNDGVGRRSVEASRESGSVMLDASRLVRAFMDVNHWKDMFPGIVSKAAIVDIISDREDVRDGGAMQLMFAELHLPTPMVPAREVYFVRYCKEESPDRWVVVDVSIDKLEEGIDAAVLKCRKRPSGCVIEDKANGRCEVTWVEHVECQRTAVLRHDLFWPMIASGLAFGARRWMATLRQQCERQVFSIATNVPPRDTVGVSTEMGRKSVLMLAQRMTYGFYHAIGASTHSIWKKLPMNCGNNIRMSSRKNLNDFGEPTGVILCATSSIWLPILPKTLFGFLKDGSRRKEWDVMFGGTSMDRIAYLAKGQDRGNSITIDEIVSKENGKIKWLLQDCCTNSFESTIVFSPVDVDDIKSAIAGYDSSKISMLPSGFSILSDGMEMRPQVLTSRNIAESGSLLTIMVQILVNSSPMVEVTLEAIDTMSTLVLCILRNVKKALHCEEE